MLWIGFWSSKLRRWPSLVSWPDLLALSGIWVTVMLGLLGQGAPWWFGWPYALLVPSWAIWRKWSTRDLELLHEPELHREWGDDDCLHVYVTVTNNTGRTIDNVSVRVDGLERMGGEPLREYKGEKLDVADTGFGTNDPADKSSRLHRGESEKFYVVRVCHGGHVFTGVKVLEKYHRQMNRSGYSEIPQFKKKPRGILAEGRYRVTLRPQGNNAVGDEKTFEFWSGDDECVFTEVTP